MEKKIGNSWDNLLDIEFKKDYFISLEKEVDKRYNESICYPEMKNIFNAFKLVDFKDVKVVILGQDPYHNEKEAMGLSFSVPVGIKIPPSLKNIYKEMMSDIGLVIPKSGDLTKLAKEGVFLLNTTLTVESNKPMSHSKIGWSIFTDNVISLLNKKDTPIVFILWGNPAREKKRLITNSKHLILESAHPSPLSAYNGFFNNHHFSKANDYLIKSGITPINWRVIE